jgi:CHAT domain
MVGRPVIDRIYRQATSRLIEQWPTRDQDPLCRELAERLMRWLSPEAARSVQAAPEENRALVHEALASLSEVDARAQELIGALGRSSEAAPSVAGGTVFQGGPQNIFLGDIQGGLVGSQVGAFSGPVSFGAGSSPAPADGPKPVLGQTAPTPVRILFLGANPQGTTPLRLDEEVREIDQALNGAPFRASFDLRSHWAVRVRDLQACLLRHRPQIVHFSGHGSQTHAIYLEDDAGQSREVPGLTLAKLLAIFKESVRCVVLNACYSQEQAQAIAQSIDCVVGMSAAIGDQAAISFATAFYQALAAGADVRTAFDLGCVQIDLNQLGEEKTPKLIDLRGRAFGMTFCGEPG